VVCGETKGAGRKGAHSECVSKENGEHELISVAYKDDWANIRRVDQAAASVQNALR
jgi:hypothetical protein